MVGVVDYTTLAEATTEANVSDAKLLVAKVATDYTGVDVLNTNAQTADDLMTAKVDAANETAATSAVNALFAVDGSGNVDKTALNAGTTSQQVADAKALVEALKESSTVKAGLQADIATAESLLADVTIDYTATGTVSGLPTDVTYDDVNHKLVVKGAFTGTTFEFSDDTTVKVATLANGTWTVTDKAPVDDEATKLANATSAVNALFADETKAGLKDGVVRADVDAAQALVDALQDGQAKTDLQADVTKAEGFVQAAEDAVAEQAKVDTATTAVNALFDDETKSGLKAGVVRSDVDAAQALVEALQDGQAKTDLQADVTKAEGYVQDAEDAAAEQAKVDAATTAVNALFADETKAGLKDGVVRVDVDSAKALVEALKDGQAKTDLEADVTKAEGFVQDAEDAAAEQAKVDAAKTTVAALFVDGTKAALADGVDRVAVAKAEVEVDALKDGQDKTDLLTDVNTAKGLLPALTDEEKAAQLADATTVVNALFADNTKAALANGVDRTALYDATVKVVALTDGTEKDALLADLDKADALVTAAEEAAAEQVKVDAATVAVNGLFADETKAALAQSVGQTQVDAAKALVEALKDGQAKTDLQADITKAEGLLNPVTPPVEGTPADNVVVGEGQTATVANGVVSIQLADGVLVKLPVDVVDAALGTDGSKLEANVTVNAGQVTADFNKVNGATTTPIDSLNSYVDIELDSSLLGGKSVVMRVVDGQNVATPFVKTADGVKIKALYGGEFALTDGIQKDFSDVPSNVYSKASIDRLVERGIVQGQSEVDFGGRKNITRGEFAVMAARALGLNTNVTVYQFSDVKSDDWYAKEIQALFNAGLVNGTDLTKDTLTQKSKSLVQKHLNH